MATNAVQNERRLLETGQTSTGSREIASATVPQWPFQWSWLSAKPSPPRGRGIRTLWRKSDPTQAASRTGPVALLTRNGANALSIGSARRRYAMPAIHPQVQKARDLMPMIAAAAPEHDQKRELAKPVVKALIEGGF